MQKYANLADLVKSLPTSIYLQRSASIQPRTSLSKFEVIYSLLFIRLLNLERDRPDRFFERWTAIAPTNGMYFVDLGENLLLRVSIAEVGVDTAEDGPPKEKAKLREEDPAAPAA